MSWLLEMFAYKMADSGYEDPEQRREKFVSDLQRHQDTQAAGRTYADISGAQAKNRFGHLRLNPFYEQRNKMFPHRRYERREPQQ